MKKIKIAFVGTGYMATEYAKILINLREINCELVAAMSKSENRIINFVKKFKIKKHFFSLNDLMKNTKPDIVIVTVNESSSYNIFKKLSKFSCVCLFEKPIGLNFEESEKIIKLKKNKNFFPYIALNRRFYSSVLEAKKILTKDQSRRIINIFDQENTILAKRGGQPIKVVRNWMYANAIHMIDFAYIFGRGNIKKIEKISKKNYLKNKHISSKIYFTSGDVVNYFCTWNRPAPWSVQISSDDYFLELKPIEKLSYLQNNNRLWHHIKVSSLDEIYKPGLYLQLKELFRYYFKNQTSLKGLNYSHKLMKLIRVIYFD